MAETNDPGLFRSKAPSGAELWAPGRLTRRQRVLIDSASRPPTNTPDGTVRRFFDFEMLADECLIQVATGPEADWTLKDDGLPVERSRQGIDGVTSASAQEDLIYFSIAAARHFYPLYFLGTGDPEGEASGENGSSPTNDETATSDSSPSDSPSSTKRTKSTTTS